MNSGTVSSLVGLHRTEHGGDAGRAHGSDALFDTHFSPWHDREVTETPDAVEAGLAALRDGDWDAAKQSFEAALAAGESPEALDGLGQALWWLNDVEAAIDFRERAYVSLVRDGLRRR